MKSKVRLIHGGAADRVVAGEHARRDHLRLVRANRERHAFADIRMHLVDTVLEHRLRSA